MRHITSLLSACLLLNCLALPILATDPAESDAGTQTSAPDRFRFDGVWKPKGAMLSGVLLPPPALESITLTISENTYTVVVTGEDHTDKGTFTTDDSVTPHRMTITSVEGPNKGKTIKAIYEIKGPDAMRACYDLTGTDYPTEFKAPKGQQYYLVGYRRQVQDELKWIDLLSTRTESLDEHWNTTGNWKLQDGVATLTPRNGESGWSRWSAYLWSKKTYEDFDIQFEYKVEKGGNSGFYFRVGDVNDPVSQGIEVQIYATAPDKAQDQLSDHDAGGIIPGLKPHRNNSKSPGEWNKVEVRHFDDQIVVMLNGETVNAHDLSSGGALARRPRIGQIGFQDHALPISLRNIRIRTPSQSTGSTIPSNE